MGGDYKIKRASPRHIEKTLTIHAKRAKIKVGSVRGDHGAKRSMGIHLADRSLSRL